MTAKTKPLPRATKSEHGEGIGRQDPRKILK